MSDTISTTRPPAFVLSGPDRAHLFELAAALVRANAAAVVTVAYCPRCEEWRGPHDCEHQP